MKYFYYLFLLFLSPESKQTHIYYSVNVEEIDGNYILFKGKFQFTDKKEHRLKVLIQLNDENGKNQILTLQEYISEPETDWNTFTVSGTIPPNTSGLFFSIISEENCSFRICDCQAYIDEKPLGNLVSRKYKGIEDREFDNGSAIRLQPLSGQMIDNLEVLGKVWGFLKYYHPAITRGDYELAILELAACLKDTHVGASIPNPSYQISLLQLTSYSVPASLTFTDKGEIVVSSTSTRYLDRGDQITHIDGCKVQDIRDGKDIYIEKAIEYIEKK